MQDISEFDVVREDVRFMLPKQIREAVGAQVPQGGAHAQGAPQMGGAS